MWSRVIWGRTGVVILECRITVCNYLVEQNTRLVCVYSVVTRFYPESIRIFPISDCLCCDIQTRCFVSPHQHPLGVSAGGSKSLSTRKFFWGPKHATMTRTQHPAISHKIKLCSTLYLYSNKAMALSTCDPFGICDWRWKAVIHNKSTYMMTYLITNNKGRIRGRKIKPTRKLLTLCAFCCFLALWRKRYLVGNLA